MTDRSLDELGPVDYLIVEFPAGQQNFTGEGAVELVRLHDAGIIRIMDVLILQKAEDGTVMAQELSDLAELGELARIETELAQTLAEEDVDHLAAAMDPGSIAGVLVYENLWAAPFASAMRRAGGQLIANGRIPVQAIVAAVEADAGDARSRRSLTCRSDQVAAESASSARPSPRPPSSPPPSRPARRRSPRPPSSAPPCRPARRRSPRPPSSAPPSPRVAAASRRPQCAAARPPDLGGESAGPATTGDELPRRAVTEYGLTVHRRYRGAQVRRLAAIATMVGGSFWAVWSASVLATGLEVGPIPFGTVAIAASLACLGLGSAGLVPVGTWGRGPAVRLGFAAVAIGGVLAAASFAGLQTVAFAIGLWLVLGGSVVVGSVLGRLGSVERDRGLRLRGSP